MTLSRRRILFGCLLGACVLAFAILNSARQKRMRIAEQLSQTRHDTSTPTEQLSSQATEKLRSQEQQLQSAGSKLYNDGKYSEGHPRYALASGTPGRIYLEKGDLNSAEPLLRDSSQCLKKTMGDGHPYYAESLQRLGELYRAQGKFGQAEESLKQALTIYEQALGKNHPKLVEPLKSYSAVVRQNGREDEAKTLEDRIETIHASYAKRNTDWIVR